MKTAWRSPSRQPQPLPTVLESASATDARSSCVGTPAAGQGGDLALGSASANGAPDVWATPRRRSGLRAEGHDGSEASPSDSDNDVSALQTWRGTPHTRAGARRPLSARGSNNTHSTDPSEGSGNANQKTSSASQILARGLSARPGVHQARTRQQISNRKPLENTCPASLRSVSAPARTQSRLGQQRSSSASRQRDGQLSPEQAAPLASDKRIPSPVTPGKENLRPCPAAAPQGPIVGERDPCSRGHSREVSAASRRASSMRPQSTFDRNVLPCNRALNRRHRDLATARGPVARAAFREALISGAHKPRSVKLGFVGAARAGKTSTLRALAGLPLRINEESTTGLAVWEVSHELLSVAAGQWQLQEARGAAGAARWDSDIAQFVADRVQAPAASKASSSRCSALPSSGSEPDAAVLKKMPVDLIAHRLGEGQGDDASNRVILETYDFGGQEVYYAMHHLFLTDHGVYLACIDLSTVQATAPESAADRGGDLMDDAGASAKEQGWEALEWWLASVSISAPNSSVAIVGTHDDCLDSALRPRVHELVHHRIAQMCTKIPDLNDRLHVNEADQLCFFPIDNSGLDGGESASNLRGAIDAMSSVVLSGTLGQPIPLRWAHFWAALQRCPASDDCRSPLIRIDDLFKRCSHYSFESLAELHQFLQHFRSIGALLHFPEAPSEDLRDLVCLDPAWVADAAASVFIAKDRVLQGCMRHSAELRDNGRLHSELLAAIWRSRTFARHQKQLVELLQVLDLLMPWGQDRVSMPQSQHASAHQVFLVPSLLPLKPPKPAGEPRADIFEEDSIVMYLDFHGLLHRLLPTLFPRVLCALTRIDPAIQILTMYANYATFTLSTQGQSRGDSARSQGGRRQVQKLMVHLQPCAGGELLRCCLRPRRGCGSVGNAAGAEGGVMTRPSWRHADRLLHMLRDAVAAWMPQVSFRAGVRCPACVAGRVHSVDLHSTLRDEVALCPRTGEPIEELPPWLAEWRSHLRPLSPEPAVRALEPQPSLTGEYRHDAEGLQLEYLYAAPLDAAPLDIRAELEMLSVLPGLGRVDVRTATTEVLSEVWRSSARLGASPQNGLRVLRVAAHCAVDASVKAATGTILLEDAVGRGHAVNEQDLAELLVTSPSHMSSTSPPFDVVILDACNSERLARCFVTAGAPCAVACAGTVFDAAARAFLRAFLRALAADGDDIAAAFAAAQRAVRLSPQPGLRAEAGRFRLLTADVDGKASGDDSVQTQAVPQSPSPIAQPSASLRASVPVCNVPTPIEDFTGRKVALTHVAQAFLNGRRVVWMYGASGIGKSALAAEFCRFYALPGDRLFSPTSVPIAGEAGSNRASVPIVQFRDLAADDAMARLLEVLQNAASEAAGREGADARQPSLLVLEDVGDVPAAWWALLEEHFARLKQLRLLFVSREPRYDAPISCKIVAYQVEPLAPEDAALLLLRRVHRPLFPRDFEDQAAAADVGGAASAASEAPLAMAGLAQRLSRHPLLVAVGFAPGAIIAAAAEVTPLLSSLLSHPALTASRERTPEANVQVHADVLPHATGGG